MKHTIKSDGAPFFEDGKPVNDDKSTAGGGHAICSCGAMSDWLLTRSTRKAWHATHKENTVTEQNPEETTHSDEQSLKVPLEPADAFQDIPADTDEIEVVDTPAGAADDSHSATVAGYPEKKLLPAYFFLSIVKQGVAPFLAEHLNLTTGASEKELTVYLAGEQEAIDEAKTLLEGLYVSLPDELADFKKNLDLKDIEDPKERHKKSWLARRDFCVEFAQGFSAQFFEVASKAGSSAYLAGVEAVDKAFEDDDLL